MNDLFESWKSAGRFINVANLYVESDGIMLVLTDIAYWNEHYDELQDWCAKHGGTLTGMTLELPDEATLILFTLRWA